MKANKKIFLMTVVLGFCAILISALLVQADGDGEQPHYVFSIDSKGISRSDTRNNEKKLIYDTEGIWCGALAVSPTDTLMALLITEPGYTPPGAHDYSILPKNSMVFISSDGKEIATLDDDVRKFSWSPDGEKVAYIAGTYHEGGIGFRTTGVGIFGLGNMTKTQIRKDFPHKSIKTPSGELTEGGGYDIYWARHDSNIYVQDFDVLDGVYRYNTKTGKSEKVDYHGIHFSPDGKYYLDVLPEDPSAHLYVSATNEEISDRVKSNFGYLPQSWMPDQEHHMLVMKVQYEPSPLDTIKTVRVYKASHRKVIQKTFYIYDVDKDQIVKEWIEKP